MQRTYEVKKKFNAFGVAALVFAAVAIIASALALRLGLSVRELFVSAQHSGEVGQEGSAFAYAVAVGFAGIPLLAVAFVSSVFGGIALLVGLLCLYLAIKLRQRYLSGNSVAYVAAVALFAAVVLLGIFCVVLFA